MKFDHSFSLTKSRLPIIYQNEASECGLACIAMVSAFFGLNYTLRDLRKIYSVSLKGMSVTNLLELLGELNFEARAVRLDLSELDLLKRPAIIHWEMNHFVVLKSIKSGYVIVHDPSLGEIRISKENFSNGFSGVAIEVSSKLLTPKKSVQPQIKISDLIGRISGLKVGLTQILALAITLEFVALLSPLISQWIMDEAIASSDLDLLQLLSIGLFSLGVISILLSAARSWVSLYISTSFRSQWMANIMRHMISLPVEFFERRHIGDIISRFNATHSIEQVITSGSIELLLDGILAIGTLIVMLFYSPKLSLIAIGVLLLYFIFKRLRYATVKLANSGILIKQAQEQTYFLETIRGIRSIKLFNKESLRLSAWTAKLISTINAELTLRKIDLTFSSFWAFLSTSERVLILMLGAKEVMSQQLSIGMLFAFLAYKEQFVSRGSALIEKFFEFAMLGTQLDRLSDIVLSDPEKSGSCFHDKQDDLSIRFDNVSFRYGRSELEIITRASFMILPGECVAIVGASGSGKTTLFKLMLGILHPTSGSIYIGKDKMSSMNLKSYRSDIATVMQDDQIYAGSIFDNICFFDENPDKVWIESCAKMSNIHDDILKMPMRYNTLVGDMGAVLSGGQKQRVLLARALYHRPKILFLDEATSHLDVSNEKLINAEISALGITRVIIAHREQTIAMAHRVLTVSNGRVVEGDATRSNRLA